MWEYDVTKAKANQIVLLYESQGAYEKLCELVRDKQDIFRSCENYV